MYMQNKLLKDFLKFLEKNTPNLKDLKGAQGFWYYIVKLFAQKSFCGHLQTLI